MSETRVDPSELAIPDEPLPVSVLTGFLGSGKTTVLRHLLGHPAMEETAVVVNEFGEVGLDHLLVETAEEDTVLLNSGCLCCTVRGDLIEALRRLYWRRVRREVPAFRRLVIETTGLAGVIINNGIVLIDRIDGERARGTSPYQAVIQATISRFRPIMMSAITTMLGVLPLIVFRDPLFYSLACVIAFGLALGTVLSLLVVPVLYSLFMRIKPA